MKKVLFLMIMSLIVFTSCENDLVSAPPSDSIITGDTSGDIVGRWDLKSLTYTGTNIVTTTDGVENQIIDGVGSNFNYLMNITDSPNNYSIIGSFDVQFTVTIGDDEITTNETTSGSSNGSWTKNGNTLTTIEEGSSEALIAEIQVLDDNTLRYTVLTLQEDNSNPDATTETTLAIEYVFERL